MLVQSLFYLFGTFLVLAAIQVIGAPSKSSRRTGTGHVLRHFGGDPRNDLEAISRRGVPVSSCVGAVMVLFLYSWS